MASEQIDPTEKIILQKNMIRMRLPQGIVAELEFNSTIFETVRKQYYPISEAVHKEVCKIFGTVQVRT